MGKIQTTQKAIKNSYNRVFCVNYCELQFTLGLLDPDFYTAGIYGWNADIYEIDSNTALVTGYRPFGTYLKYADYHKFEEKAKAVVFGDLDPKKRLQARKRIYNNFVKYLNTL